jgi:hypothetical protein
VRLARWRSPGLRGSPGQRHRGTPTSPQGIATVSRRAGQPRHGWPAPAPHHW